MGIVGIGPEAGGGSAYGVGFAGGETGWGAEVLHWTEEFSRTGIVRNVRLTGDERIVFGYLGQTRKADPKGGACLATPAAEETPKYLEVVQARFRSIAPPYHQEKIFSGIIGNGGVGVILSCHRCDAADIDVPTDEWGAGGAA